MEIRRIKRHLTLVCLCDTFRDDEHLYKADDTHLSLDGYELIGLAYMVMTQELR